MNNSNKKVATLGMLCALAIILSYIELLLPPIYAAVPGIKIGLPNVVIVYILYRFGVKHALLVSLLRVIITNLLFTNGITMLYSLCGALLSIGIMLLLKKTNKFSTVGVSIAGAIAHNLGQILVAMLILQSAYIGYYMIVLTLSATIAGVFVGVLGGMLIKRL